MARIPPFPEYQDEESEKRRVTWIATALSPATWPISPFSPAAAFINSNFTNELGVCLPYYYLLPTNYTAASRYPLVLNFHGSPGDETMMSTPTGYLNFPRLKVFASGLGGEHSPCGHQGSAVLGLVRTG